MMDSGSSHSLSPTESDGIPVPTREGEGSADSAIERALGHLAVTQCEDGSWWGDYGGPMFLLPLYVALCHLCDRKITERDREGMRNEFLSAQRPNGGVGLHREGSSCVFTTTLAYVSLRLLGESKDREELVAMRRWIGDNGSAHGSAPWGKWVLCLLGIYDYRGIHPITPELWLLPRWIPLHPGRLWCHCRMVYLPMSWLYATRFSGKETELIRNLRIELFGEAEAPIDFRRHRHSLAPSDAIEPLRLPIRIAHRILALFECVVPRALRKRALDETYRQLSHEDQVTEGIAIGPVNRVLNTLCHFHRDPDGEAFARGFERASEYLWQNGNRVGFQGYNHSRLWDTAFAVQACAAAGAMKSRPDMVRRAFGYIDRNQVREDVPEFKRHYRDRSEGGWPFSDREHGWPITDCTAEGLKSSMLVGDAFPELALPRERIFAAIDLLLVMQNPDGGWPTYERQRAGSWLESFNPSGVFSRIMVDYSYPECTSAVLQALARTKKRFPGYRADAVATSIERGAQYLRRCQREDGSWEGSWGVCFTYGTWFGVSGLTAIDTSRNDPALLRARDFLLQKQQENGSWGEEIESCRERKWIERPGGHVVQTAWALLSLLQIETDSRGATDRAATFLRTRQGVDGNWPDEGMVGMFNRTCAIHYDWYRLYFPLWALAAWKNESRSGIVPSPATSETIDQDR